MALSKVTINKKTGGLARNQDSKDGYSGLLVVDPNATTSGSYDIFDSLTASEFEELRGEPQHNIEEYFRFSDAPLYVKLVTETNDYEELEELQRFANGNCRQIGILDLDGTFSETDLSAIQTVSENMMEDKTPSVFYLSKPISGTVESLPDLSSGSNDSVQFLVGEDLQTKEDLGVDFLGSVGTRLGQEANTKVGESSAWAEKTNVQSGTKYARFGFVDGTEYKSKVSAMLNDLDNKKYGFFVNHTGFDGVFPNYDYTSTGSQSDFSSINFNKVFNKAFRQLNAALTPKLNSKLKLNSDGTLSFTSVKYFENLCDTALSNMETNEELSGFVVSINPAQNVLQNDTLNITVKIQPNPTAKFISVDLGFTLTL